MTLKPTGKKLSIDFSDTTFQTGVLEPSSATLLIFSQYAGFNHVEAT